MPLAPSELIINPDGSIYHLNLKPDEIASTIITVGDPDRVEKVTENFDSVRVTKQKREFKAQTGTYNKKEITVISTGIGTDNIDIVLNELDALVNIDFATREIKKELTTLNIIRIGTSGAIQTNIPIDSFLMSTKAVGFDSLLRFYDSASLNNPAFEKAFVAHMNWNPNKSIPYWVEADESLTNHFSQSNVVQGITATNVGFYGPQGRQLRLVPEDRQQNDKLVQFKFEGQRITNLEMETAGIYGLSKLLGHRAISLNAILANRATGEFSKQPEETTQQLIKWSLDQIAAL